MAAQADRFKESLIVIRYPAATAERIARDVEDEDAAWAEDAKKQTDAMLKANDYLKTAALWSRIKIVYMNLQHNKCIFCERALAQGKPGAIEQDVEHFRPKNAIRAWPPRTSKLFEDFVGRTGGATEKGYYWLACNLANYGAACKPCNTIRKASYFPIAGKRPARRLDPDRLDRAERPYLIFPYAEDPERLITFDGVLAVARAQRGIDRERALVTIDLFDLNGRGELVDDRFRTISEIMSWAEIARTGDTAAKREEAVDTLKGAIMDGAPQAACARAFVQLMDDDYQQAWTIYREAKESVRKRRLGGG